MKIRSKEKNCVGSKNKSVWVLDTDALTVSNNTPDTEPSVMAFSSNHIKYHLHYLVEYLPERLRKLINSCKCIKWTKSKVTCLMIKNEPPQDCSCGGFCLSHYIRIKSCILSLVQIKRVFSYFQQAYFFSMSNLFCKKCPKIYFVQIALIKMIFLCKTENSIFTNVKILDICIIIVYNMIIERRRYCKWTFIII